MTGARPSIADVEGIGFWSTWMPGWSVARDALTGARPLAVEQATRPVPSLLPATERRRAPDTIALALDVALQACRSAGRDEADLPSVFTSMHGDLAITDYQCATLASTPAQLSPTKFHNSVHNAAAGYWTIGTRCHLPYIALAAGRSSFGSGLLDALAQVACESRPVLVVAYDIEARGPLAHVSPSTGMLGAALVLAPQGSGRARCRLGWRIIDRTPPTVAQSDAAQTATGNAMSPALPLMEALARAIPSVVVADLGPDVSLELRVLP